MKLGDSNLTSSEPVQEKYDLFVCYDKKDLRRIELIVRDLEQARVRVFRASRIPPGERWNEKISEALRDSSSCGVFIGRRKLRPWQQAEMNMALVSPNRCKIIPILLTRTARIPPDIQDRQAIDFNAKAGHSYAMSCLISAIRNLPLPSPAPVQPSAWTWIRKSIGVLLIALLVVAAIIYILLMTRTSVVVDAVPWGTLVKVVDADGDLLEISERHTPLVFGDLVDGESYTFEIQSPSDEIEVLTIIAGRDRRAMAVFENERVDIEKYFKSRGLSNAP